MPEHVSNNAEISRQKHVDLQQLVSVSNKRDELMEKYNNRIIHNPDLDRSLVSFQANKDVPFYNWFKYKEGFSRPLVRYLLENTMPKAGHLLDPFAGAGSALFASAELGWTTHGIEVLPVGVYAMQARLAAERVEVTAFKEAVHTIMSIDFAQHFDTEYAFKHIRITEGAFPEKEEQELIGYIAYCNQHVADADCRQLLLYAAFCVLESISFTRKDGQYLRWDARSGRSHGKSQFNKGYIPSFGEAIEAKLLQMREDLVGRPRQMRLFDAPPPTRENIGEHIAIDAGSCLEILPTMPDASIDGIITSPPYANRYDYTRTYALELVYLGCSNEEVKNLRQTMLSCTVENKDKREQLLQYYTETDKAKTFHLIDQTFNQQEALHEVLNILDNLRAEGRLNNPHILRLVHNYFYEMCFVIYELARVLRPGGTVAMVNDNVRYAGEEIPVDLILSDFAETFGLTTQYIWTLGRGKGNSSQQMGSHGRSELRKCVYIWQKE